MCVLLKLFPWCGDHLVLRDFGLYGIILGITFTMETMLTEAFNCLHAALWKQFTEVKCMAYYIHVLIHNATNFTC
jgi:Leu/Phe-tRNA-protein transferase